MKLNQKLFFSALASLFTFNSQSFAAGYSTMLYSASGLGNSYAGSATGVHDVSDMFFNPAIISDIKNSEFIVSVSYLHLSAGADGGAGGSFSGGTRVSGSDNGFNLNAQIPALYIATPVNDKISVGLSVTSPFGLATEYDKNWAGKYHAVESSISTLNINPTLSYKFNENFSVGAGFQAQHYQATLTKAVYTGGADAYGKVHGSDWGYGYNLGLNYKVNEKLKLGLGYRSKIDYKLTGTSQVIELGLYSDVNAKTTTPESLTAGLAFQLNNKVELVYDTTWTRWSRLKSLVVNASQNSSLNDKATFNWHNSLLNSAGANFKVNDKWLVRTGAAYEKDAVTNSSREPRVPTGDRIWTSIGFNYKIKDTLSVDGSYIYQIYRTSKLDITDSTATSNSLNAHYRTRANIFSLALKKEF